MTTIGPASYATAAHKRPKKTTKLPPYKGDLRPPDGILKSSPVNQAKLRAALSSQASQAPVPQKAAAATAAAGATQADLISSYNLERAKILQGMAPQIQDIYQQAGADLGQQAGGARDAVHSALYEAGGGKAGAFNDQLDPRIAASYNPDAAPNASYYLGATLPGDTLNKQGAAFGAAAAFAPGAALQEGQYALVKAVNDAKVANADAAKVSAPVSKMLGYLSDAYGNPIKGKNGKPVKLPDQNAITPYQQAQLKLSGARLDNSVAATNARLNQSEDHFVAGMNFKTAKAKADYAAAEAKGAKPNAALSAKYGYVVDSNGRAIPGPKGRHIPVVKTGAKKGQLSVTQNAKLDQIVTDWYNGKQVYDATVSYKNEKGNTVSQHVNKPVGQIGYQVALRKLRREYGLSLKQATERLDQHWARGERGRPFVSFEEAKLLSSDKRFRKWGITPTMIRKARSGGIGSADAHNAAVLIDHILSIHNITL